MHPALTIGRILRLAGLALAMMAWPLLAGVPMARAAGTPLQEAVAGLGADSRQEVIQAIEALGSLGDPAALPVLEALQEGKLRLDPAGRPLIVEDEAAPARDALTGQEVAAGPELRAPRVNNMVRRSLEPVMAKLRLFSSDPALRLAAAKRLSEEPPEAGQAPMLVAALEKETDPAVRQVLGLVVSLTEIKSPDKAKRLAAIKALGASGDPNYLSRLEPLTKKDGQGHYLEPDPQVRRAARWSMQLIYFRTLPADVAQCLFYGLSLASVLLLASLGLAITFGLMGVINMAHGEMLMLGAYGAYVTQNLFRAWWPEALDWYPLVAVPVAFALPAVVGMILERSLIRHLVGRPLETLLCTWGISLLLIQAVRLVFGAQNVEVANPSWLSGGWEAASGLMLTYNRLAIIAFVTLVVLLLWFILNRTSLGLRVRAVTQNRGMASALGVQASRVDMWTFGLGCGIAGLGGLALSQIGNVGPELGQSYIVDCFMTVVLGGVGKLAGTVWGALGLGVINKVLEPFSGAVLGKIMILVFVILFIQKRPQGIFAVKGRQAEG
ncbi:MAG: urea ABC transporter permease subunit UrtB [Pseudomonadota bacterium]